MGMSTGSVNSNTIQNIRSPGWQNYAHIACELVGKNTKGSENQKIKKQAF
jgi:hypothetical protein